ncbi:MAG TPA: RHS repeat-associated core domain-containing protein, partial [Chryseosolibacter sp.]|nr:RHS repeat-associated core domain-containing protein [Chryseosolibacter sp.]
GLNNWGGLVDGGTESSDGIAAFVTILVFDSDFDLIKIISDQISSGASSMHDYMKAEYTIREAGYVYMYISNHSNTPQNVYFDDVRMAYEPSNVIQYNEYYAHGLPNANSWTRDNARGNRYLANGGTEFNDTTKLYDLDYRNFDPVLGRMNQVDPVAGKYAGLSPYNFSFNNPVGFVDPTGADPLYEESYYYAYAQSMGMDIGQYQRIMDYGSGGAAGAAHGRMAGVGEAGAMPQSYDAKIEARFKMDMIKKGINRAFRLRMQNGGAVFRGAGSSKGAGVSYDALPKDFSAEIELGGDNAFEDFDGSDQTGPDCPPGVKCDQYGNIDRNGDSRTKDAVDATWKYFGEAVEEGTTAMVTGEVGAYAVLWVFKGAKWAITAHRVNQARKTAKYVNLASEARTTHILVGDSNGGGHMWSWSTIFNGKSKFPITWSAEKIMNAISEVATSGTWVQQSGQVGTFFTKAGKPARFYVMGSYEGVSIKVIVEPAGEGIITAFPIF